MGGGFLETTYEIQSAMTITGIVMGVGSPNKTASGEKTMCAILLTEEMGFIRIYPIEAERSFPVWSMVEVEVNKGSDNRDESWKIESWKLNGSIDDRNQKRHILKSCELKSGMNDPIDFMNEQRKSIALISVEWGELEATLSQRIPSFVSAEDEEFGWVVTQDRQWLKPYVTWTSRQGKVHKSHLFGREIYEGIRRNPTEPWDVMNNLQIMNPDYEKWMLLGNMKHQRNVWLCVHMHRLKKQISGSIPHSCNPIIGKSAAWPYEKQENINVPIVDGHPELFTMRDMISEATRGSMIPAF